ncbi:hypothetical protein NQ317_018190 [Molorchus minor]|uniref:Enoyl-CoA hydratase n=1 Tax=Molorchus minor TaxID=1323400 RepID=A0ABQ9JZL0_9CUCU|nr:hypothetical protein NQ317_018190 [Molorchus minor]
MPFKICTTKILRLYISRITRTMASKSSNNILVDTMGHITTIGINRPEKRNCLDQSTVASIRTAIEDFENDKGSMVAVLYGTGGNFCSGIDLDELANLENSSEINSLSANGFMGLSQKYVKKPMVAAISGYAVAGGLELALMCDLRVMEDTAVVGLYGRRFGVPLTDGGTVRLQAVVGLSRALDMILTGRSLTGKEAFEWGWLTD